MLIKRELSFARCVCDVECCQWRNLLKTNIFQENLFCLREGVSICLAITNVTHDSWGKIWCFYTLSHSLKDCGNVGFFTRFFFRLCRSRPNIIQEEEKNNPVTHKHTQKNIIMQMKRFFLCKFFHRIFFPNLCTICKYKHKQRTHNDATKTVQEKTHPWQKRHFRYFNHISFVSFAFRNSCLNVNFVWELQNKMKLKGKKGQSVYR